MKYFKVLLLCSIVTFVFLSGCTDTPVNVEGNASLTLKVMWASSDSLIPLSEAKVIIISDYGTTIKYTDENGMIFLEHMPSAYYNIAVRKQHPEDNSIIVSGSLLNLKLLSGDTFSDTIYVKAVSSFGISINEVYSAGPVNDINYLEDQFIELYNPSDSIKYLDGIMVMRFSHNSDKGIPTGSDWDEDNDIDGITYAFRFPGETGGNKYPIYPNQFIVLASDARDHRKYCSRSIDLSNSDWEFYNQFSFAGYDNPGVPNLRNMVTRENTDFYIRTDNDIVIVSTGADSVWTDGIYISSIIDGVEYGRDTFRKTLDNRIDRSAAVSPPRYTGRSIRRKDPGVDSNNGILDWEIIPKPTPGYH